MFECVIFDLDGLMVDSERITREIFTQEAKNLDIQLDEEFFEGIIGTTKKTSQAQFNRFKKLDENISYIREKRFSQVFYEAKNNPNFYKKGLNELLEFLFKNNYKVAIATSSNRDYVDIVLKDYLNKYKFDAICTGDMVKNHKPDPEVFLLTASLCNVSSDKCLVLEDSRNGIIAAKNANMSAGFIYDTVKPNELIKSLYDYSFNSLNEVIDILKR